jgi:hypothetical protein
MTSIYFIHRILFIVTICSSEASQAASTQLRAPICPFWGKGRGKGRGRGRGSPQRFWLTPLPHTEPSRGEKRPASLADLPLEPELLLGPPDLVRRRSCSGGALFRPREEAEGEGTPPWRSLPRRHAAASLSGGCMTEKQHRDRIACLVAEVSERQHCEACHPSLLSACLAGPNQAKGRMACVGL